MEDFYNINRGLLQDIVKNLEAQPAAHTRHLLNAIENLASEQDKIRAEIALNDLIKEKSRQADLPHIDSGEPEPQF